MNEPSAFPENLGVSHKLCIVCGAGLQAAKKYDGLLTCTNCGFLTTDLRLSENDFRALYSENYFMGEEYANYINEKFIIQKNFARRLKALSRYIDIPSEKTLFEIGCAYGFFLDIAQQVFGSVSGIDVSADAVQYAKKAGLNATAGNFLTNQIPPYDICCLWDTIEHLPSPDLFIKKISHEITPNGILALTTGDLGSFNAKVRGKRWRQIHPPTHLHYFSVKNMKQLLMRYGFKVLYIGHPSNIMSLDTIFYLIFVLRCKRDVIYNVAKKIGILKWNIPINMFDLMFFVAQKE